MVQEVVVASDDDTNNSSTATALSPTTSPVSLDKKDLKGYLCKKTKHGKWQQRWFETNDCFLTYYKKKGQKLLAALNLPQVGEITLLNEDNPEGPGLFTIQLNERLYTIRASNRDEAKIWVEGLQKRQNGSLSNETNSATKVAEIEISTANDDITRQINERVESMRSPVLSECDVDKNVRRGKGMPSNRCAPGCCFIQ